MKILFDKPAQEIMRLRHSVRSYENKGIPQDIIKKIEEFIKDTSNPFGVKMRIVLMKNDQGENEVKLGTYGVIKGAKYFLAIACENKEKNLTAVGYVFEKVILYCTSLGLGTVWMGGTFSKGNFAKAIDLKDGEILPIVSPVGYESSKKGLLASIMGNNNNKRKKFSDLFFEDDFDNSLEFKEDDKISNALECVRIAPSAINKQPWRVLKINDIYHFFNSEKRDMHNIDIGIALCHFELACREQGINGEIQCLGNISYEGYTYVASWVSK